MSAGWTLFNTELGVIGLSWKAGGIARLVLPEATAETMAKTGFGSATEPPDWVQDVIDRLRKHVTGDRQDLLDVPLALEGVSSFRRAVYEATRRIAAGETMTYGTLAQRVGSPGAARAIGTAMATNPVPIIMPCHRVLAANGQPGGFSAPGGLDTKARLLEAEGVQLQASRKEEQTQLDWVLLEHEGESDGR